MTALTSKVFWGTITVALALLFALAPIFFVHAASRDAASRVRDTGRTEEPAPAPAPTLPPPPPSSGSIVSNTDGVVDTGGNEGGTVTTGPEHVEVIEINIGPSAPPPPVVVDDEDSAPAESDDCGTRGCRDTSSRIR